MSPITHLLASWVIANTADITARDRALVTLSGVAHDIDALGIVAEVATKNTAAPLYWWSQYHHVLGHNIGFGLVLILIVLPISVKRRTTGLLALLAFHLHLLFDLIGARGPDGYQWPIPYLLPFSGRWQLSWEGQWALNAWPNILFTVVLLAVTLYLAWMRGFSPFEMISKKVDALLVSNLRKRFGNPKKIQV